MARQLRIEFAGAFYHVIDRGVARRAIFGDSADYVQFISICMEAKKRHRVEIIAYCLMPNHYHFFLCTLFGGLGRFMQEVKGQYGRYYNDRYERVGPIYQGRYRAILVEGETRGMDVARYIHLNPVKARLSASPLGYRWSSYGQYAVEGAQGLADTRTLLGQLADNRERQRQKFKQQSLGYSGEGYDPTTQATGGIVVGGEEFLGRIKRQKISRKRRMDAAGLKELQQPADTVKDSLWKRVCETTGDARMRRKLLAYGLRKATPLPLKRIAELAGFKSIFAVSQLVRRLEAGRAVDRGLDQMMLSFERRIRSGQ